MYNIYGNYGMLFESVIGVKRLTYQKLFVNLYLSGT